MCKIPIILALALVLCLPTGCSSTKSTRAQNADAHAGSFVPAQQISQSLGASVRLNYLYVTLDDETLDAINESSFIRNSFALYGYSLPDRFAGNNAEATYLLGDDICIELFAAPQTQQQTEGNAGICFSTKQPGQIDAVYDGLREKLGSNVYKGMSTFNTGDERIPWLHYVSSHSVERVPPLLTWVTEHDPAFLEVFGQYSDPRRPESFRTNIAPEEQKLLRKVISITLDLTQSEFDNLYAELSAYGYFINEQNGLTVFTSEDFQIRAAVQPNPQYRIRTIRCLLRAAPTKVTKMTFGQNATLTLTKDATAIWTFGPRQTAFVRK